MKNYFKSVLLILGLLLFIFGCQKESIVIPTLQPIKANQIQMCMSIQVIMSLVLLSPI